MWEDIYFCSEWRANYLWLWIQTCNPSRFDYSTFVILFLTSYFVVSKWWPISESNKSYFFPLVNFGSSWTAGTNLLLSGLHMTVLLPYTRVTFHITWPESSRFQNSCRLSVQKICRKFDLAQCIVNLLILDSLTSEECIRREKRKKFGVSYPLKIPQNTLFN